MEMTLQCFGKLREYFPHGISLQHIPENTDELILLLKKEFPVLASETFSIAINKELITKKAKINTLDTIVLLPPFSGG